MFLRHFGLNDDPFGVTPEPRYLYESITHREALASLKYGFLSNRGFTALIAAPGLGKTTLLRRFLGDIGETARSVFLFDLDGECEPRELIASILRDLGVAPASSSNEMHEQLNAIVTEEARAGRIVVVVIDEAQNLSDHALETVRLLSNFETTRAKLIHIVLAGQPQLSNKLMQPGLVQLRQRVATICRIDPLSATETVAYIDHRLRLAGHIGEPIFTDESLDLIARASQGIPRIINNLCFNALSICRALNKKQVVPGMVKEAIADSHLFPDAQEPLTVPSTALPATLFRDSSEKERSITLSGRWKIAAAVLLFTSMLGAFGYWEFAPSRRPYLTAVRAVDSNATSSPSDPMVTERVANSPSASGVAPFQVRVGRNQTLRNVALRYIGEFNEGTLKQIRALNPALVNQKHLHAGQTIWLPGPQAPNLAESKASPAVTRKLP